MYSSCLQLFVESKKKKKSSLYLLTHTCTITFAHFHMDTACHIHTAACNRTVHIMDLLPTCGANYYDCVIVAIANQVSNVTFASDFRQL